MQVSTRRLALYRLEIILCMAVLAVSASGAAYAAQIIIYPIDSQWVPCNANQAGSGPPDLDPRKFGRVVTSDGCYVSFDKYNLSGLYGRGFTISDVFVKAHVGVSSTCIGGLDLASARIGNCVLNKALLEDGVLTEAGAERLNKQGVVQEAVVSLPASKFGTEQFLDVGVWSHGNKTMKNNPRVTLEVKETNCMWVASSRMCGFADNPWEAVKTVLLADQMGQWFYVMILLPIPMTIYLTTRNGAYAGFASMGLILLFNELEQDPLIVEVALTMILIASGFLFYEVLRKRLFASI